jgi:hypothetical protein
MKILTVLAAVLLSGCTADQQQRFADGYFGEPGHTFREAMFGTGNTGHPSAGGSRSGSRMLESSPLSRLSSNRNNRRNSISSNGNGRRN